MLKTKEKTKFKETEIGIIPDYWELKELQDVAYVIDPHPSHRAPKMVSNGFPFPGIGDISEDGEIDIEKCRRIGEEYVDFQEKSYEINDHSIGYGRVGTVGKVVILRKQDFRYALSPTLSVINPNEKIDKSFLYYAIKNDIFFQQVYQRITGTTRPTIGIKELRKLLIVFPPLEEQKRIAKILSSIDQKIRLIKNKNRISEKIIRTIFKSWFIDFDGQTEFINSDLGKIPKNWKISTIKEICSKSENGSTPRRNISEYWENGTISWFKTGELENGPLLDSEEKITEEGMKKSSCHIWPPGTILIAMYGATAGKFGILTKPATSNQACNALQTKKEYGNMFLLFILHNIQKNLHEHAVGSAQQNLNKDLIANYKIILPPSSLCLKFQNTVESIYDMIINNYIEIQKLETFRNNLLPKLMTGEIRF